MEHLQISPYTWPYNKIQKVFKGLKVYNVCFPLKYNLAENNRRKHTTAYTDT